MNISLLAGDALLIVDMQNDFLEGGSLAVPEANDIIPFVNDYIALFTARKLPVFASRDYHPEDHISFIANGGLWPVHCVAGSYGAEFHPTLKLPASAVIISKATSKERDAYSAMDHTELPDLLKESGVERVFVCGLATDYCVLASCLDLLTLGYTVFLLADGIKGVNISSDDSQKARAQLKRRGATEINRTDITL